MTSQSKKKVKVAVVDRGLDCALPESDGWVVSDQDIKGTMWAGIIRERAPEAEIYRIQIGGEKCGQALVAAITWNRAGCRWGGGSGGLSRGVSRGDWCRRWAG